jgi:hypothetical protein
MDFGRDPRRRGAEKSILFPITKLLERDDVDVNAQNADGNTALMEAVRMRRGEVVKKIAAVDGCRFDLVNNKGQDAAAIAGIKVTDGIERVTALLTMVHEWCSMRPSSSFDEDLDDYLREDVFQ